MAARSTSVLGATALVFAEIAVLAPEARKQPAAPFLGLALLAALSVVDASTPAAVASSALMVGTLVVRLGIWRL
jgi:hypothetical protein